MSGLTYRAVSEKTGVSLGAMNELVNEARKKAPDIDDLRQLNVTLQKSGVPLVDAMRACSVISQLDELGVGVNQLSQYVELSKKLAGEHGVDPAELVESAIRLSRMEAETGKSWKVLLEEFEEKATQLKELESKVETLRNELKDAQKQRKILQLCEQLRATGIEPERLKEFIDHRGPLEKQLHSLEEEIRQGKARLSLLAKMEKDLQRRADDILRIERILRSRVSSFACPYCGGTTFREVRRVEAQMALSWGQPLTVVCQRCGAQNPYDPRALLLNLALEVLS